MQEEKSETDWMQVEKQKAQMPKAKEQATIPPTTASTSIMTLRQPNPSTPSSSSSPYGKISAPRFRAFSKQLYAAIKSDALFHSSHKEETLFRCVDKVNNWMGEDRLSLREVSAAFVYMAKKGQVELKGEMVPLIGSVSDLVEVE